MDHPKELRQAAADDSIRKLPPHSRAYLAYLDEHGEPLTVSTVDALIEYMYRAGYADGVAHAMPPVCTEHEALSAEELERV